MHTSTRTFTSVAACTACGGAVPWQQSDFGFGVCAAQLQSSTGIKLCITHTGRCIGYMQLIYISHTGDMSFPEFKPKRYSKSSSTHSRVKLSMIGIFRYSKYSGSYFTVRRSKHEVGLVYGSAVDVRKVEYG
ncbi:hypothetical protein B0H17DRAFT_1137279 [Mycena rosella]|uniref:Uncharacterized protein n=1 Tax=Mycena rosella TaxID=1033263 RepID=A0AAD7GB22_MYCRO|nr:hypothetical protein B0H17DRAFT_1137279 [Mycena rosella]